MGYGHTASCSPRSPSTSPRPVRLGALGGQEPGLCSLLASLQGPDTRLGRGAALREPVLPARSVTACSRAGRAPSPVATIIPLQESSASLHDQIRSGSFHSADLERKHCFPKTGDSGIQQVVGHSWVRSGLKCSQVIKFRGEATVNIATVTAPGLVTFQFPLTQPRSTTLRRTFIGECFLEWWAHIPPSQVHSVAGPWPSCTPCADLQGLLPPPLPQPTQSPPSPPPCAQQVSHLPRSGYDMSINPACNCPALRITTRHR